MLASCSGDPPPRPFASRPATSGCVRPGTPAPEGTSPPEDAAGVLLGFKLQLPPGPWSSLCQDTWQEEWTLTIRGGGWGSTLGSENAFHPADSLVRLLVQFGGQGTGGHHALLVLGDQGLGLSREMGSGWGGPPGKADVLAEGNRTYCMKRTRVAQGADSRRRCGAPPGLPAGGRGILPGICWVRGCAAPPDISYSPSQGRPPSMPGRGGGGAEARPASPVLDHPEGRPRCRAPSAGRRARAPLRQVTAQRAALPCSPPSPLLQVCTFWDAIPKSGTQSPHALFLSNVLNANRRFYVISVKFISIFF